MNAPDALPRILLLEDDPVSAAFLAEAISALPARVDCAGSLDEARSVGAGHDLWLFDANLPDGDGAMLLAEWRARGLRTPALAHTADARREALDALIDAGFVEALSKPLTMARLHGAIRRWLSADAAPAEASTPASTVAAAHPGEPPLWDDAAALRALNGQRDHVEVMRGLFLQELPQTLTRVADAFARGDHDALRAELHRLTAACGFVGAARLRTAVDALREAPTDSAALARFEAAAQGTLSPPG